jgi:hypothetical protein
VHGTLTPVVSCADDGHAEDEDGDAGHNGSDDVHYGERDVAVSREPIDVDGPG